MNLWSKTEPGDDVPGNETRERYTRTVDIRTRRGNEPRTYVLECVTDNAGTWGEVWVGEYAPANPTPETCLWAYLEFINDAQKARYQAIRETVLNETPDMPLDLQKVKQ
jgi:hypothetical protein